MTGASLIFSQTPRSNMAMILLVTLATVSVLASSTLMFMTIGSNNPEGGGRGVDYSRLLVIVALPAFLLGAASILASWRRQYLAAVLASLVGMNVTVFLVFMLWLRLGIALGTAQFSAVALTGLAALLLAGYVKRRTS